MRLEKASHELHGPVDVRILVRGAHEPPQYLAAVDIDPSFAHPGAERVVQLLGPGPARPAEVRGVADLPGMES